MEQPLLVQPHGERERVHIDAAEACHEQAGHRSRQQKCLRVDRHERFLQSERRDASQLVVHATVLGRLHELSQHDQLSDASTRT